MSAGIDYGSGLANVDPLTGIRYGVIHVRHVLYWDESAESEYGDPTCPECGNAVLDSNGEKPDAIEDAEWFTGKDWYCEDCESCYWSDSVYGDEPIAWTFKDEDYTAHQSGSDCDVFILRSPYYTLCQYCSPCAPGAGYLTSQTEDGIRAYCFGPDWFEDGRTPYAVYRVSDGTLVCRASSQDADTEDVAL